MILSSLVALNTICKLINVRFIISSSKLFQVHTHIEAITECHELGEQYTIQNVQSELLTLSQT